MNQNTENAAAESEEQNKVVKARAKQSYKEGFVTDIESYTIPPGLDEDTIRCEALPRVLKVLPRVEAAGTGAEGDKEIGIDHVESLINRLQVMASILNQNLAALILKHPAQQHLRHVFFRRLNH